MNGRWGDSVARDAIQKRLFNYRASTANGSTKSNLNLPPQNT